MLILPKPTKDVARIGDLLRNHQLEVKGGIHQKVIWIYINKCLRLEKSDCKYV